MDTHLGQAKDKKKDLQIAATEGECNFTKFSSTFPINLPLYQWGTLYINRYWKNSSYEMNTNWKTCLLYVLQNQVLIAIHFKTLNDHQENLGVHFNCMDKA